MTDGLEGLPVCIFCKGSPTTVEDIFPRWIHRYLGRVRATTFEGGLSVPAGMFQSLTYTASAKCVCRKCNNGWMSDLENEASRLIKRMFDERVHLSIGGDERALISRWCMKTALMIQFFRDVRAIPESVYDDFYETRTPPVGSFALIARHSGGWSNGTNSILYSVDAGASEAGQLFGVTFFIKNLVVQIVGVEGLERGLNIQLPAAFNAQVQMLWPEGGAVWWPPESALTDRGVQNFARSLLKIRSA